MYIYLQRKLKYYSQIVHIRCGRNKDDTDNNNRSFVFERWKIIAQIWINIDKY